MFQEGCLLDTRVEFIATDCKIKEARHVSARVEQVSDRFQSK